MARAPAVVIVALLATRAGASPDPASPDRVSLDAVESLGILSATHTTLVAGYTHRFAGRAYVEARLGGGTTGDLLVGIAHAGAGLLLEPSRRVELRLGWRAGDTSLRGDLGTAPFAVHLLAVEFVAQLAIGVGDGWQLRVVPLAPTLYWHHSYGGSIGLELGVEHAL